MKKHRSTVWREADMRPVSGAPQRRGIVCLHPDPDLPDPNRLSRFRAKGGTLVALLIRERVMEERRAERQRLRALNMPVASGPDGEDHGMDLGPAALARPTQLVRVNGRLRGAGQRNATPVYARMVDCTNLFERLNCAGQLSDRQCQVGRRLVMLRRAAGLDPCVTARHAVVQDVVDDAPEDDELLESICPDGFDPRTYYRHLLRQVTSRQAAMIDAACEWTAETPTGRPATALLATFQAGLDVIAEELGLKREGVGV